MSKTNNKLFLSLSIIIVLVIGGIGYYKESYSSRSTNSELDYGSLEDVLLAPKQCPGETSDCKDPNGKVRDCCASTESCNSGCWHIFPNQEKCEFYAFCDDSDNQCKRGEGTCKGEGIRYSRTTICCEAGKTCAVLDTGFPICRPVSCEEGETACKDNKGNIICCAKEGESVCANNGADPTQGPGAYCYQAGGCPEGTFACIGGTGVAPCCSLETEKCLKTGGPGNSPICVLKDPSTQGPGGGVGGGNNK